MRSIANKTISCIRIWFSMFLPSPYYFLTTKLCEVLYFQWQFSLHSFCSPTITMHSLALMPVCYVKLVINYLSYQLTRTLLDNSGPISEDDNTMSGQLKTSRWNVSLFANPYLNPKPTKSKTSSSSRYIHYEQYMFLGNTIPVPMPVLEYNIITLWNTSVQVFTNVTWLSDTKSNSTRGIMFKY